MSTRTGVSKVSIKRGVSTIKRTHAKNYIGVEAQARFTEAVKPYQQNGLNALSVDSYNVLLFQQLPSTTICTCQKSVVLPLTEVVQPLGSVTNPDNLGANNKVSSSNTSSTGVDYDAEFTIDYSRPLFGGAESTQYTPGNTKQYGVTNGTEYDDNDDFLINGTGADSLFDYDLGSGSEYSESAEDLDGDSYGTSHSALFVNTDCGICYRTHTLPGYSLYGWTRLVLTSLDSTLVTDGYYVDTNCAPNRLVRLTKEGFCEFIIRVPLFFKKAYFSLRDNHIDLTNSDSVDLTLANVISNKGKEITVRCTASAFTHLVISFDLGYSILANISQESRVLDWQSFDSLSNLTCNLPYSIPEMRSGDLLYVPSKQTTLKVVDVPQLRTSLGANLDWSVSCRVVQPQEPYKNIHSCLCLY